MNASSFRLAVVIEQDYSVANVMNDVLTRAGYEVLLFVSHQEARARTMMREVHLLAASVPAPGGESQGAYLCGRGDGQTKPIPTILLLHDPDVPSPGAPAGAIRVTKPFDRHDLLAAAAVAYQWHDLNRRSASRFQ
ncbi:hypothetical protein [Luteibacter yeojuensis]